MVVRRNDNQASAIKRAEDMDAVLRLRKQGVPMTEIARSRGVSLGTAYRYFQRALKQIPQEAVDETRALMVQQLEMLFTETMRVATRPMPLTYRGRAVNVEQVMPDGSVRRVSVVNQEVQLQAYEIMRRQQESLRKLLGLDAAEKFQVSGPADGPIQVEQAPLEERVASLLDTVRQLRPKPFIEIPEAGTGPAVANG